MKRFLTVILTVLAVLYSLSGCSCGGEIEADLVFVNDSDATIVAVVADFADQTSGVQNANSSPLKRSETFGFEAGEYPVTVVVYGDVELRRELGRITVRKAPPEGERWYVTARGGADGLALTADTNWPEGV